MFLYTFYYLNAETPELLIVYDEFTSSVWKKVGFERLFSLLFTVDLIVQSWLMRQ